MSAIDLVLVSCVVAAAATYLAWALLGRSGTKRSRGGPGGQGGQGQGQSVDAVIGDSLQRGLDRARARRRS